MQIGVVIPTYNEAENLPGLVSALSKLPLDLRLLVVDDNSPDSTGKIAENLSAANGYRLEVLHRPKKMGIGSAYIQGFRYFLNQKVDAVGQIDADLSHDPTAIIAMVKKLETCDLVLGSRYIRGGSIDERWSPRRKNLSAWGNFYARNLLGFAYQDATTGYRLWRSEALRSIQLDRIQSYGYIFQVETLYLAYRLGFLVSEIPVHFSERRFGKTKMSLTIKVEAALRVWQFPYIYRDICQNSNDETLKDHKKVLHG